MRKDDTPQTRGRTAFDRLREGLHGGWSAAGLEEARTFAAAHERGYQGAFIAALVADEDGDLPSALGHARRAREGALRVRDAQIACDAAELLFRTLYRLGEGGAAEPWFQKAMREAEDDEARGWLLIRRGHYDGQRGEVGGAVTNMAEGLARWCGASHDRSFVDEFWTGMRLDAAMAVMLDFSRLLLVRAPSASVILKSAVCATLQHPLVQSDDYFNRKFTRTRVRAIESAASEAWQTLPIGRMPGEGAATESALHAAGSLARLLERWRAAEEDETPGMDGAS